MPRLGYARVSTFDQDLNVQLARLKAEGCAIVRSKKISGASRDGRAELTAILALGQLDRMLRRGGRR